jgi:arginyl-tRNA synthetase
LRKQSGVSSRESVVSALLKLEKELLLLLEQYPVIIEEACIEHNPSVIAGYAFHLAKTFNTFYTEHSVLNAESD